MLRRRSMSRGPPVKRRQDTITRQRTQRDRGWPTPHDPPPLQHRDLITQPQETHPVRGQKDRTAGGPVRDKRSGKGRQPFRILASVRLVQDEKGGPPVERSR